MPIADPPLFLVGRKITPLMAKPPGHGSPTNLPINSTAWYKRRIKMAAAVNVAHPQFMAMLKSYGRQPALAVYSMAKNLLLAQDRLLHKDVELMMAAQALHNSEKGS